MSKTVEVSDCQITASKNGVHFFGNAGAKNMIAQDNVITVSSKGSIGILAEEMTAAAIVPYKIERNHIETTNGYGGIVCNNLNSAVVSYNEIRFSHASAAAQMYGIELNANTRAQVTCNNIQSNTVAAADTTKMGIAVKISSNSYVVCNTVDSTGWGIYFGGVCGGSDLKGNLINNHYEGLRLSNSAITGVQQHKGNRWQGNYGSGYGAVNMNYTLFQNLQLSEFQVHDIMGTVYYPYIPPFDSGWFAPTLGSPFSCAASQTCNAAIIGGDDDKQLERAIAEDSIFTSEFEPESRIMAQQYLYDELKKDTVLLVSDVIFEVFKANHEESNIGKLSFISEKIADAFKMKDALTYTSDSLIAIKADSLHLIDSLYKVSNLTVYQDLRNQLIYSLNTLMMQQSDELSGWLFSKDSILQATNTVNQGINPIEQPEANSKLINELAVQYLVYGKNALSGYYNLILSVAEQCPYSGGEAVFMARTMLSLFNDSIEYHDAEVCYQAGYYRQSLNNSFMNEQKTGIRIIPNPAKDELFIQLERELNETCLIRIRDVAGRVIVNDSFDGKTKQHRLSIQHILSGIYQVEIKAKESVLHNTKQVIIK